MPDLIQHPESLESAGCARSLRSLRLPSVARLEFIPMKIGAVMTIPRLVLLLAPSSKYEIQKAFVGEIGL